MKIISCLAFAGIVFSSVAYADERDGSYQLPLNGVQAAPRVLLAQAAAKSAAPNVQVELDALIRAAKSESGLTIYSGATENVAKRVGDAFSAKYGIKVQFSRMAAAIRPWPRRTTCMSISRSMRRAAKTVCTITATKIISIW